MEEEKKERSDRDRTEREESQRAYSMNLKQHTDKMKTSWRLSYALCLPRVR